MLFYVSQNATVLCSEYVQLVGETFSANVYVCGVCDFAHMPVSLASALMRGTSDFNQQPFPTPPKTCFSLQWLGTMWGGKRSVFSRFCLVCYIKISSILHSILCLVGFRIIERAKYNLVLRNHQKNLYNFFHQTLQK